MQKIQVKIIEDKITFIISLAIFILVYILMVNYYWLYPSPPFKSISKKEIIHLVENAGDEIVLIETEDFYWFIADNSFKFDRSIFKSLAINDWYQQETIHKYKKNGNHIGFVRIYEKNGVTLEIEVYNWVKGYQFLKTSRDVDLNELTS